MALVAVFCFSAVAASSALAAEKKGEIVNKSGVAPVKNVFLGTSTTAGELETVAGSKIKCTGTTVSGTISSTKTGTANFAFTGCTNASGNCATSGAAGKEIKVSNIALTGTHQEEKDYILNNVTEFKLNCGNVLISVVGSILIGGEPELKLIKTNERAKFIAKGKAGKQEPEEETNHLKAKFGAGAAFENASLKAEGLEVAFEEEVEFI